ncbi:MAG: disulfide bond formation protein B [Gammaproteobacteria bacterium]|nr:disulfide bond formation protein B [Gammaproteobacteria bacterium]MCP4090813.1 disulfide bond formation protein B [Gammaproteobacteria bacterium]MCP4277240.1 disulfide bond formation protein B [Gammaproteobacteria bacterium]MCP4832862.1 disulfide bond formation protein B [Gammaproteobacteria bacterium]MCP4928961.1 disulfide bond formation protein B [Gammaproteobacteria bacterium]
MPNNIMRNINALGVLGITVILSIGLIMQIALDELPCPLCLLQRISFTFAIYGFMLNVIRGLSFRHHGIIIIGALFGGAVALRQISLHVIPGTGTYGSPVFGLHYYTWAFILFAAILLAVGIMLIFSHPRQQDKQVIVTKAEYLICWAALFIIALNLIATFLECGPLVCDDNPTSYRLLM